MAAASQPVSLDQLTKLALLARVDGLFGQAKTDTAACFDLDEDKGSGVVGDDVDLAQTAAPVDVEDAQAGCAEMGERSRLTGSAHALAQRRSRVCPTGGLASVRRDIHAGWVATGS